MKRQSSNQQKYEIIEKIGEGAYGCVYKAKNNQTKEYVALKVINFDQRDQGISSTTLRQISMLKAAQHKNIVKLLDTMFSANSNQPKATLVFQFMKEDLSKFLRREQQTLKRNPKRAKKIFYQVLEGINYLHNHRFLHRDLKPQNILINQYDQVKIADFGLGRLYNYPLRTMSKQIQTLWYRAPQLLLGYQQYDMSVDVWSLGCIFYEVMECSGPLFRSQCQIQAIFKIFQYNGTPAYGSLPEYEKFRFYKKSFPKFKANKQDMKFKVLKNDGIQLLNSFLQLSPKNRIYVEKALFHPFFDDMNKP